MTAHELARRALRDNRGDWHAALLELADLYKSGLGSYAVAYQLLCCRLQAVGDKAGEQGVFDFEQRRPVDVSLGEPFQRVEWVSESRGDGEGYDILSYYNADTPRYIEVKTTNAGHASSFISSRSELDFSKEAGDAFYLCRLFEFSQAPAMYMLRGDVSKMAERAPIDYRAPFRRVVERGAA